MKHQIVKLKDITESIEYGITASAEQIEVGPKFLRITDIQDGSVNWSNVPYCACPENRAEKSSLQPGDIVFARTGATTGKSFLIKNCPDRSVFASYLIRVRLLKNIDPAYVSHFFQSQNYWSQISKNSRGAAQPGVNATSLGNLEIPLPPLEEQRRIAAILDKASILTAAQERRAKLHEKIEASLLNNMQSILAVDSRKCVLNELTPKDDKINYGVVQPGSQFEGGIPLIRAGDLTKGNVDRTNIKHIDPEIEKAYARSRVTGNEILISCVGSIGAVALAGPEDIGANIARAVARVPVSQSVDRKWLAAYLRSATVQRYFQNELRTVSQPTLNIKQIKETLIDLPPESSQREFSRQLTEVEEVISKFPISEYKVKALVDSLQASIFQASL